MRTSRSPAFPALLAALALSLAACGRTAGPAARPSASPDGTTGAATTRSPEFPVTIVDDDGVEVTVTSRPERIVTYAPSLTEVVFALGLGGSLVGVAGPFDDHPPEALDIPEVGGAGEFGVDPNVEAVVSLEPDLFITISGGEHWKDRLREIGVPVVTLDASSFDDLLADIEVVGRLTGATAEAEALVGSMAAEAAAVGEAVSDGPRVTCFFEVYYGPPLTTVGPGTFLFDLLEMAGCDPVSAGARADYPSWSVDRLVAESPDVYLATPESAESAESVAGRPGFHGIEAVAEGRIALVDSDLVTRPGPRVVEGLRALAEALHP